MTLTRSILRIALVTAAILLIPFVAMQFKPAHEEGWSLFDFIVAGVLLFSTGLVYELISRQGSTMLYRLATVAGVAAGLLTVWVNLAVGIIGTENNPANLLFAGVLAVALGGAFAARFRPRGMARTMLAAAFVQFAIPVLAILIWKPELTPDVTNGILGNMLFVGLWVGSAVLFWRSSITGSLPNTRLA